MPLTQNVHFITAVLVGVMGVCAFAAITTESMTTPAPNDTISSAISNTTDDSRTSDDSSLPSTSSETTRDDEGNTSSTALTNTPQAVTSGNPLDTRTDASSGNGGDATDSCSCRDATGKFLYILLGTVILVLVCQTVITVCLVRKTRCKCCQERKKPPEPNHTVETPTQESKPPLLSSWDYCEIEFPGDTSVTQHPRFSSTPDTQSPAKNKKKDKKKDEAKAEYYPYSQPFKPRAKEKMAGDVGAVLGVKSVEMEMAEQDPSKFYFVLEPDPVAETYNTGLGIVHDTGPVQHQRLDQSRGSLPKENDSSLKSGPQPVGTTSNGDAGNKRAKPAGVQLVRSSLRRHSTNVYEEVQLTSYTGIDADNAIRRGRRTARHQSFVSLPDLADLPAMGEANTGLKAGKDKAKPKSPQAGRGKRKNKKKPPLQKQQDHIDEDDDDLVMVNNIVYVSADDPAVRSAQPPKDVSVQAQKDSGTGIYQEAKSLAEETVREVDGGTKVDRKHADVKVRHYENTELSDSRYVNTAFVTVNR